MWVPELPFQLACQREAHLKGRPLAFLNPETPQSPSLWFLNRAAKGEGLRSGDPMDLALRQCPGLRLLDPQPQTWWEAQGSFADFLQHWSPQGVMGRMGEAMVELGDTRRIFGTPRDTAWRMRLELQNRHGWDSHGGLSLSATAAQLAAHMEQRLEVVGDGSEASFLAPHPLRRLPGLAPRIHTRFRRLGLECFGDLQPVPLPVLLEFVPEDQALKMLGQVRGEDRPKLPMLADPPGESRLRWRLEPPRLPEEVNLGEWCLDQLWAETRSPRRLTLRWEDVDGEPHLWKADPEHLFEPPLVLARRIEQAFRDQSTRRLLVRQVEMHLAWGLGQAQSLFQDERLHKLGRIERVLAKLRRRFPQGSVKPGWMSAS